MIHRCGDGLLVKICWSNRLNFEIRTIVPSGGKSASYYSQYRLDGVDCGREAYLQKLAEYCIFVKARNFLVFQGDIESVAQMNPKVGGTSLHAALLISSGGSTDRAAWIRSSHRSWSKYLEVGILRVNMTSWR